MKTVFFITMLFFAISASAQKFSSGMTKRMTVLNTDEILIKAAGNAAPQFTTPVELFAGRAIASSQLSDSINLRVLKTDIGKANGVAALDSIGKVISSQLPDTIKIRTFISGTTGKLPVFNTDSTLRNLTGGATGQVPKVQSNGSIAFENDLVGSGTANYGISSTCETSLQTLTDINGLSLALDANSVYEIYATFQTGTSADTNGAGYGFSSTGGGTISGTLIGSVTTSALKLIAVSQFATIYSGFLTTANQYGAVQFQGIVITPASAITIKAQHVKTTTGTSSVYSSGFIKAIKMP